MADIAAAAPGGDFSIGRVGSRIFEVLGRNLVNFFVLALLAVIPQILLSVFLTRMHGPAGAGVLVFSPSYLLASLGTSLLSVVMAFVLQAALTYGTVMDLSGRRVSLGEALNTGLRVFLPVALIGILFTLGIGLGCVLLLVPGLMIATAWSVVVPVRVAENTAVLDTFSRSAQLTKGHRWPIFGLLLIYGIGVYILAFATRPLFGMSMLAQPGGWPIGYIVFSALENGAAAVISATGVACIYYELRSVKEGLGPEQLAAVFD